MDGVAPLIGCLVADRENDLPRYLVMNLEIGFPIRFDDIFEFHDLVALLHNTFPVRFTDPFLGVEVHLRQYHAGSTLRKLTVAGI